MSPYPGCAIGASSGRLRQLGQRPGSTLDPVMPTYEYACTECGQHVEIFQSMRDDTAHDLPAAAGASSARCSTRRRSSFKGSGFYATDHGKKSQARRSTRRPTPGLELGRVGSGSRSRVWRLGSEGGSGSSETTSDAKPPAETKKDASSSERRREGSERLVSTARDRRLRRLGLLLVPRGHRDRRGRHAVRRRRQRRRSDRRDRRPAGRVHPPARRRARVPAAPDHYRANLWAMKELGVDRVLGPSAVRLAAGGREARRLRGLRPARRPHARPAAHLLRRSDHDAHLVRRPVLRRRCARRSWARAASSASRSTTAARSS